MGIRPEVVERLRGVIIALPTPMHQDGRVDARGVGHLVEWLVDRGVDGIFACGTTGEGPLLAAEAGADALAIMAPFYFRHSDAALIAHFAAVADAIPDHPVLLYNIPQNTGNPITPSVVRALLGRPNLVGMKDSTGDPYAVLLVSEAAGPSERRPDHRRGDGIARVLR